MQPWWAEDIKKGEKSVIISNFWPVVVYRKYFNKTFTSSKKYFNKL